jgi:N-methylhydantoinase A
VVIERSLDMSFSQKAQSHPVPIGDGPITMDLLKKADTDYRALQMRMFSLESSDTCRITGARVRISSRTPAPPEAPVPKAQGSSDGAIKNRRPAWFDGANGFVETPVYDRGRLAAGHVIHGPAIFEEADATTICPPGFTVTVDDKLNLLITASKGEKVKTRSAAPAMAE